MPLNSWEDNRTDSAFTSKLSPAADVCVGIVILLVAAVETYSSDEQLPSVHSRGHVVLSVLGNGLVLVICHRRRRKMAGSELLCVNLAVVDFLGCVCFYPLSILSSFRHAWLGHEVTCVYYGLGCYVFGLCGMLTVAAISVARYLKTCSSPDYVVWLEGANIRAACCLIWLVAAVWSSFPLFGWGQYVPEPYGLSCTIAWRGYHTSAKDAFYVICSFACFTLLPVLLIVVSQCRILHKVAHFSSSLSASGVRNNLRFAERRLSVMFFCISLGFIVAWAPYAVVSFLYIFHEDHRFMAPGGFVFPALLAKSSHVYNPFIYFYFNKTFQRELRCLLPSIFPKPGGNRVGAHGTAGLQEACPVHIQLQERVSVGRRALGLPQERTYSGSRAGAAPGSSSSALHGRPVYTCWGSMSRNLPTILLNKPTKDSLPVSI